MSDWLYRRPDSWVPWAVLQRVDDYGIEALDLIRPTGRLWLDSEAAPPLSDQRVDANRVRPIPTPARLLDRLTEGETWRGASRRSLGRLVACFLLCEDPQRRLDAQPVVTLAHQASLVRHVLQEANLQRVLIADEVGLGKTIEAGLIVRELTESQPGSRILYLAPARLVRNVRQEFDRLGLSFRIWVAGQDRDARLEDSRVIASIHRASHPAHFQALVDAPPWDVLIVDECHHLSAWTPSGGAPVRKYKLVELLTTRLRPGARVVLLSGTPHQGHRDRFENLLRLLRDSQEDESLPAGRVIYRTKDDVRDWDGHPLFPRRQVNPPVLIDLGAGYRGWLRQIHHFFEFSAGREPSEGARKRAADWRVGMALQWATSSVQAGLGFLVRQAIRAGMNDKSPALSAAASALRPYRNGPADEPVRQLLERMAKDIGRQLEQGDLEDLEEIEEDEDGRWHPDLGLLSDLLESGVELLRTAGDAKWDRLRDVVLSQVGDEKVVLFAQPIETVTALAGYLQRTTGCTPALVMGNQEEEERARAIESFWRTDGPQFLISSRAGGEGLNLQVSRRLVHVDVPWNPMELEQRVGRVHRFRSRRTILVDTVVVKESREVDCYKIARERLADIARVMVSDDRFEELFSRVMALVPPDELQSILGRQPLAPFSHDDQRRLQELVKRGFEDWRSFDGRFKALQQRIRELDPGQASWQDVARFAQEHLGARPREGFSALSFRWNEGEVVESSAEAQVFEIEGRAFACGDYGGMPITGADGTRADQLGLNSPAVVQALRRLIIPDMPVGAAHLRWPDKAPLPGGLEGYPFGVLAFMRQSVRIGPQGWVEAGVALRTWVVAAGGACIPVSGPEQATLVRTLLDAVVRLEPEVAPELMGAMRAEEERLVQELRRPSDKDREERVFHAVFPIFAAVVAPGGRA